MKAGNGKAKGDRFMNELCRSLSVWLVPGDWTNAPITDLPVRIRSTVREPLEGHWHGKGDLLAKPSVKMPFSVEAKKIEGWQLDGIHNDKWPVWEWWDQCTRQADAMALTPLLLFSRNRRPIYALLPEGASTWLRLRPSDGPVLRVTARQKGRDGLVLALLSDLTRTSRNRALRLTPRSGSRAG